MSNNSLRPILDAIIAARQPVSEDLMHRYRDNSALLSSILLGGVTRILAGAVDSVLVGAITDADPTTGEMFHDNQLIGRYIRFTSGTVFTANNRNRFKIINNSVTSNTITVSEDLASLGVAASDTYVVLGHTHDGDATSPDGGEIDFKDLINQAEDLSMTQALVDAIMDPDSNRVGAAASKANPLITKAGLTAQAAVTYETSAGSDNPVDVNIAHGFAGTPTTIDVDTYIGGSGGTRAPFINSAHWTSAETVIWGFGYNSGFTDGDSYPQVEVDTNSLGDIASDVDTMPSGVAVTDWGITSVDGTNIRLQVAEAASSKNRKFRFRSKN